MTPLATSLLDAYDRGRLLPPPSEADPSFSLPAAYRVAAELIAARQARGERFIGRKIGFTNRAAWPRLGVDAPIWGAVWDTTAEVLPEGVTEAKLSLDGLTQPRLEPEVVLGLRDAPASDALADVVAAIDWVAHGFEVVRCPYPGWKFTAADGVAAFGLHARLIVGPRVPAASLGGTPGEIAARLANIQVTFSRDGEAVATGRGADVLGGPVESLAHLVRLLEAQADLPPLRGGEVVTTGTLTDAQPLAGGQAWRTAVTGAPLAGLRLTVTER